MGSEDQKLQTKNQTRRNDTDEHTNDLDTLSLSHSAPRQRRSLLVVCRNFGANTPQREVYAVSSLIRSRQTNTTPLPSTNPRPDLPTPLNYIPTNQQPTSIPNMKTKTPIGVIISVHPAHLAEPTRRF